MLYCNVKKYILMRQNNIVGTERRYVNILLVILVVCILVVIGCGEISENDVRQAYDEVLSQSDRLKERGMLKLVKGIKSRDSSVRLSAIQRLFSLRDINKTIDMTVAIPGLIDILKGEYKDKYYDDVRRLAILTLGLKINRDAVQQLLIAANDQKAEVRAGVIFALSLTDCKADDSITKMSLSATNDQEKMVRIAAIESLFRIGIRSDQVRSRLNEVAKDDPDLNVRQAAVQTLANLWKTPSGSCKIQDKREPGSDQQENTSIPQPPRPRPRLLDN